MTLEEILDYINPTAFQFIDRIYDEFLEDPYEGRDILKDLPDQDLAEATIAVLWQADKNSPAYVKNIAILLKKRLGVDELKKDEIHYLLELLPRHRKLIEDCFAEGIVLSITKAIQEMF